MAIEHFPARTKLLGAAGHLINEELNIDGDYYLGTTLTQHVYADPLNSISGTDTLKAANSYTWSGSSCSTLGVAGIQISLFADKDCNIHVYQSPNGTNWDIDDVFIYKASTSFGVTIQAISSYFYVKVTSLATTGAFRFQTALCPVVEAVPRTLDPQGNFKISSSTDAFGFQSRVTPMGGLHVAQRIRLIGSQFDGAVVDGNYWTVAVSTGTVTQAGTELILTSGTANAHYARAYSVRRARYMAGVANAARIHIRLPDTGTANVRRRWGLGFGATMPTVTDGAYFELDGTTFSVVTSKAATSPPTGETRVSSGAFNGHYGYSFTPTAINYVYEILYTNEGVYFSVDNKLLHFHHADTATWTNTMNLHLWLETYNTGNSSAVAMYCRTAEVARLGHLESQPKYYNISGAATTHTLKLGAGILHKIIFNNTSGTSFIIYDNTTGADPKVGSVTSASAALGVWDYHLPFYNGLVIVTTGANWDATVIYE